MDDEILVKKYEEQLAVLQFGSKESDRGKTLIVASHIELLLRRIIESFLIDSKEVKQLFDGPYAPFSSLSGKTKAAYVMGLITKSEHDRIDAIRGVRNVFAHHTDASFEHKDIAKVCRKAVVDDGRLCARDAFLHMALNTATPLLYRDVEVKNWKRSELAAE